MEDTVRIHTRFENGEHEVVHDQNDLETKRKIWFKHVNKVIIGAVWIRLIANIICLSSMIHATLTNDTNTSVSMIIAYIALLVDIALIIAFSSKYAHRVYHLYFKISLIISIFIYYPRKIILIVTFIINLYFLWILALTKVNVYLTKEVNKWMYDAQNNDNNQFPNRLRGIFYMDGNPVKEDMLTFENGDWDKDNNTLTLQNINNYNWSFEHNDEGLKALQQTKFVGFNFKVHFDQRIANGDIDLYSHCCPVPKCLYHLTFEEIENDNKNWKRRTIKCRYCKDTPCHDSCYYDKVYILRKVYDKDRNIIDDSFKETTTTYCIATL